MRFIRYDEHRLGLLKLDGSGIVDLTDELNLTTKDPLMEVIRNGPPVAEYLEYPSDTQVSEVEVFSPLKWPRKIIGAGKNYLDHVEEMSGNVVPIEDHGYFLKPASSIIGPNEDIVLPFVDRRIDHEVELALIISDRGKRIPREDALEHVFGYTLMLDISMRGEEKTTYRKSFDTFGPMGPCVVTRDEIPDPNDLAMSLSVNDEVRQSSSTGNMLYDCAELIAFCSSVMTLHAGDMIMTGTPSGTAPLTDGDEVEAEIEGIGKMEITVGSDQARYADIAPKDLVN